MDDGEERKPSRSTPWSLDWPVCVRCSGSGSELSRAKQTCSKAVPRTGLDGEARAERCESSWGTERELADEECDAVAGVVDVDNNR